MDYINFLPDHLLIQVFVNLSPGMTKSCCLVCKRWDEIIGTSSELMERFILDLTKAKKKPWRNTKPAQIHRKHQFVIIDHLKSSLLDVITRHNLKYLILTECGTNLSILVRALNNLPSLKGFYTLYVEFVDDISVLSDSLKKVYTNIEELKCVVEITHIFECCTIKQLSIRCRETIKNWETMAVDFLKRQKSLEVLKLRGSSSSEIFTLPDIFMFKFSLKKFKFRSENPFQYYEAFIKFLSQHKDSLTSLDVYFRTDPQFGIEFIHKFALENIVNLKHLSMGFFKGAFGSENEISFSELPAATQIIRNLKSLSIKAQPTDILESKRFFDMMPNLKYLIMDCSDDDFDAELLNCISERCLKLESLKMFFLPDESHFPVASHFPKLKELIVEINCENEMCAFIDRHSQTLERIILDDIEDFTRYMARTILNCPNLNYFELNTCRLGFASVIMIHEISLKSKPFTLVLPRQNYKFNFPDDKAIFDAIDDNELDYLYED